MVMNGLLWCGECWWIECEIIFLLVFDLFSISMVVLNVVIWLIIWCNVFMVVLLLVGFCFCMVLVWCLVLRCLRLVWCSRFFICVWCSGVFSGYIVVLCRLCCWVNVVVFLLISIIGGGSELCFS